MRRSLDGGLGRVGPLPLDNLHQTCGTTEVMKVTITAKLKLHTMPEHTSDANRPNKGLLFVCQNCHYTLHADLVGARNITMRTLLARQDWARTGQLSVAPDVSDAETKAARLARYAELRWSPDTSPRL